MTGRLDVVVRACSPALKETISVDGSSLPTGVRIDVFGVTPFLVNTTSAAVEISVAGSEAVVGVGPRSRAPIPIAWHDDRVSPWDSSRAALVKTLDGLWPVRITRMWAPDYRSCEVARDAERKEAWGGLQLGAGAAAILAAIVFLWRRRRTT
ncbi:MAG TPA: hypothetical protein PKU70_10725 [Vicinamibacteria bacterium]|nr:hypothetical protein [Vicinamibacteria bacterium]